MENLSQIEGIPACFPPVQDSIPQDPVRDSWHPMCRTASVPGFAESGEMIAMCTPARQSQAPLLAVILEEDPLTSWSVKQCLDSSYEVVQARDLQEAAPYLARPDLSVVICGSPIVECHCELMEELVRDPAHTVVALVSDAAQSVPEDVIVVEKPFALCHLAFLLRSHTTHTRM